MNILVWNNKFAKLRFLTLLSEPQIGKKKTLKHLFKVDVERKRDKEEDEDEEISKDIVVHIIFLNVYMCHGFSKNYKQRDVDILKAQ